MLAGAMAPLGRGQQAPTGVDPQIWGVIERTPAIDNHAHPVLSPPDDKTDREFDALPVDNMEPEADPLGWRADFALLKPAYHALWGYDAPQLPLTPAEQKQLESLREQKREQQGSHYSQWVLDQAHIGTMLANRVAMGNGVEPPRFRWVPYVDALLFPLDNSGMAAMPPDRKLFFALEDKLRARYVKAVGLSAMPATLDGYLAQVVTPTLERQHANGAVAEKFEVAYLRGFNFTKPTEADAARVYAKFAGGGTPGDSDYKLLQDFLFRYIAAECGRMGMAVHLHAFGGAGSYFVNAGVNPMLLEPVLNDPSLRHTNFVFLHGGWPYVRELGSLLTKPNVYTDLSMQSLLFSPHVQAEWLAEWLEYVPEKVMFGTDGYPFSANLGWEESAWIASHNERRALGLALTEMVHDGFVTEPRAEEIAADVLRGNAERLYHLNKQ